MGVPCEGVGGLGTPPRFQRQADQPRQRAGRSRVPGLAGAGSASGFGFGFLGFRLDFETISV